MKVFIAALVVVAMVGLPIVLANFVSIREDMFFLAPRVAVKAKTASEMQFQNEEQLLAVGEHRPAVVLHEFVRFGGEQIAISHVRPVEGRPDEPLIVHCGGNAADRPSMGVYYSQEMLPWGEALLFDYPGYGDSSGRPTVKSLNAVLASLAPWVDELANGRPLIMWGQSLGGLICAKLASQSREVDGVILETTGVSPKSIAQAKAPPLPFLDVKVTGGFENYDIEQLLKGFSGPVLVVGAAQDAVLPVALSHDLEARLRGIGLDVTYVEVPDAGHMDAARSLEFSQAAEKFFKKFAAERELPR